jgi:hypothetical protein
MTIFSTPHFDKEAKALLKKYPSLPDDLELLFESLLSTPVQGTPLGFGCYKIRLAIRSKGRGKSGGGRVITCVKIIAGKILLISVFDKSAKASLSDKELMDLLKKIPGSLK